LPTNLQNFTQKDLTEVKIFQKVLGRLLFSETPCSLFTRCGIRVVNVELQFTLFATHLQ